MTTNLPHRQHGFMIKGKDGRYWGRPSRGSDAISLYKTKKNAEAASVGYPGSTVVEVTLTIEEKP